MRSIDPETYVGTDGSTFRRERGQTPNGNEIGGNWVFRDAAGAWVDYGQYRNDLADRHGLDLWFVLA